MIVRRYLVHQKVLSSENWSLVLTNAEKHCDKTKPDPPVTNIRIEDKIYFPAKRPFAHLVPAEIARLIFPQYPAALVPNMYRFEIWILRAPSGSFKILPRYMQNK